MQAKRHAAHHVVHGNAGQRSSRTAARFESLGGFRVTELALGRLLIITYLVRQTREDGSPRWALQPMRACVQI